MTKKIIIHKELWKKILISACLIGDKCKYNGGDNKNPLIEKLLEQYELIPFCPEVEGGLKTPRDPAEIIGERVKTELGRDVSFQYNRGADLASNICLYLDIKVAILKETSPSCGVNEIYDGTFSHRKIKGQGITTKRLRQMGVRVISENDIESFLSETK